MDQVQLAVAFYFPLMFCKYLQLVYLFSARFGLYGSDAVILTGNTRHTVIDPLSLQTRR